MLPGDEVEPADLPHPEAPALRPVGGHARGEFDHAVGQRLDGESFPLRGRSAEEQRRRIHLPDGPEQQDDLLAVPAHVLAGEGAERVERVEHDAVRAVL